eukprot:1178157-Prorocentrum_minimum.AAC.2
MPLVGVAFLFLGAELRVRHALRPRERTHGPRVAPRPQRAALQVVRVRVLALHPGLLHPRGQHLITSRSISCFVNKQQFCRWGRRPAYRDFQLGLVRLRVVQWALRVRNRLAFGTRLANSSARIP